MFELFFYFLNRPRKNGNIATNKVLWTTMEACQSILDKIRTRQDGGELTQLRGRIQTTLNQSSSFLFSLFSFSLSLSSSVFLMRQVIDFHINPPPLALPSKGCVFIKPKIAIRMLLILYIFFFPLYSFLLYKNFSKNLQETRMNKYLYKNFSKPN